MIAPTQKRGVFQRIAELFIGAVIAPLCEDVPSETPIRPIETRTVVMQVTSEPRLPWEEDASSDIPEFSEGTYLELLTQDETATTGAFSHIFFCHVEDSVAPANKGDA